MGDQSIGRFGRVQKNHNIFRKKNPTLYSPEGVLRGCAEVALKHVVLAVNPAPVVIADRQGTAAIKAVVYGVNVVIATAAAAAIALFVTADVVIAEVFTINWFKAVFNVFRGGLLLFMAVFVTLGCLVTEVVVALLVITMAVMMTDIIAVSTGFGVAVMEIRRFIILIIVSEIRIVIVIILTIVIIITRINIVMTII